MSFAMEKKGAIWISKDKTNLWIGVIDSSYNSRLLGLNLYLIYGMWRVPGEGNDNAFVQSSREDEGEFLPPNTSFPILINVIQGTGGLVFLKYRGYIQSHTVLDTKEFVLTDTNFMYPVTPRIIHLKGAA